jgi:hypothetical protein
MWNAPEREVSAQNIVDEHMRVLDQAIAHADEFGIGRSAVQRTVEYCVQSAAAAPT